MTQKVSEAPICVPKIIFAFHPKFRVQCVRRPALCAPSALAHPSSTGSLLLILSDVGLNILQLRKA